MSNFQKQQRKKFEHVVITGASSGLGQAMALHYAAPGVMLSLTGRNKERLNNIAKLCQNKGAQVNAGVLCVTNKGEMKKWLLAQDEKKPVDVLIANAGISAGTGGADGGELPQQVRKIFAVNLEGVLNTIEPLLPKIKKRDFGHIALMSSLAGFRGFPGAPAYCASKAAVKIYGESLRSSLSKTGIQIHVICPGFVKSRMTEINDFPMPFLMKAPKAAQIIARGIEKKKGRIAFPKIMYFFVWVLSALPNFWAEALTKDAPSKTKIT